MLFKKTPRKKPKKFKSVKKVSYIALAIISVRLVFWRTHLRGWILVIIISSKFKQIILGNVNIHDLKAFKRQANS